MSKQDEGNTGKMGHAAVQVDDLERQPMLMLVCGETGVGKTYRNIREIRQYMKNNTQTGKRGRKVLVFDVNDDDYELFRTVSPDHIRKFKALSARRIRPLNPDGSNMNFRQKRETVEKMVKQFTKGLLVLEDIDKFMVGAKGQSVVELLTTNRHAGLDIMISHQSIAKITTTEWQNCTYLRLHKQVDDIIRYKNRIPNYFLVRIATMIVEDQYDKAERDFAERKISREEYKKRRSFFVYVDMRRLKIIGCSKKAFIRACKKYLDTEANGKVVRLMKERDGKDQPLYPTRSKAVVKLIEHYLRHYSEGMLSPMDM